MTGDMNDGPTIRIKTVSTGELPFCQRCGQRAVMTVDLRPFGGNVDALCRSCDRAYPGRVAWLDLLASGKLKGDPSEAIIEEAKQAWDACVMDFLSAGPLGLATYTGTLGLATYTGALGKNRKDPAG